MRCAIAVCHRGQPCCEIRRRTEHVTESRHHRTCCQAHPDVWHVRLLAYGRHEVAGDARRAGGLIGDEQNLVPECLDDATTSFGDHVVGRRLESLHQIGQCLDRQPVGEAG